MTDHEILDIFRRKVCREIDIEAEGLNRHIVYTPFRFDDGDHFVITLRRQNGHFVLSDEGHTFMHLSYKGIDLSQGQRGKLAEEWLASYGVNNENGELLLPVPDEAYGDALFSFIQALTKISTLPDWSRQRVASTFLEDFRSLMGEAVPAERLNFDYNDRQLDPERNYPVSCRIVAPRRQYFGYAIANENHCQQATISVMHYERAGANFGSFAVFEDQTEINRRAVAQLSDVIGKQFASIGVRDRIVKYLKEEVLSNGH